MKPLIKILLGILLLTCSAFASSGKPEEEDKKIIDEMNTRLVATQKQFLAATDPAEQLRLQGMIREIQEETLPKLSPKTRTAMLVSFKIAQPIHQESTAYMQQVADYGASPKSDFTTIKSRDDIRDRVALITKLDQANTSLATKINTFETRAAEIIEEAKFSARDKRDFLAGISTTFGRQAAPLKAIRTLDTKMYAKFIEALQLLDSHWGKWKATEGEPIEWDDEGPQNQFATIVEEIQVLAAQQAKAQQVLSQRLGP